MNYYLLAFKKYAEFGGRASRSEYWYFVLFNLLVSIALGLVGSLIDTKIFGNLYGLVALIPAIAVGVRRLHDTGKSGWMLLISLIPLIGWIWIIVLMVMDSTPGDNQYGPNPKGSAPATV